MADGLQLVVDAKAILGEGPCWDHAEKKLLWVDIIQKKVHIYNPSEHSNRSIQLDKSPGAVVIRKSGGTVLALEDAFVLLNLETEKTEKLVTLKEEPKENRLNDGKCDAKGRFWAGTMPLEGSDPVGSLYCLNPDLTLHHIFDGVACSNGIAWSPDNRTMYYIDSPTKQVVAFDFDIDKGVIARKRVAVTIPDGEGVPDGMTIDAEGMLWVAQWDGSKVSRWNPSNGKRLDNIPVPAQRVTSCAFGGENLDELYITTARSGLDEDTLEQQPLAGGLFRLKVGVKGSLSYVFQG